LTVAGNDLRNYNDAHSQCVHGGDDDLPAVEVAALCRTAAVVQLAQPGNRPTHLGVSIPTSCKPRSIGAAVRFACAVRRGGP